MTDLLKPGTRCVIVAGCPENIGLIITVIEHLGHLGDRSDAYRVCTVSGRPFKQLWYGDDLKAGGSSERITDRWKLRPLIEPPEVDTVLKAVVVPA